jgi:hypothetical protein
MPVVTVQEKSCENMDKSGLYDNKRNIIAHKDDEEDNTIGQRGAELYTPANNLSQLGPQ